MIAGPYCGSLLADLGADVTYVEHPSVAVRRAYPPKYEDGTSAFFAFYNRGKRSITLDLTHPEGLELLFLMCEKNDVLLHNVPPARVAAMGLDFEAIHERLPHLVVVVISAFGQQGPFFERLGVDGVAQALGGLVALNGEPDGSPLVMGSPIVDSTTGIVAALGAVSALVARSKSGKGSLVDANLLETAASLTSTYALETTAFGVEHRRVGSRDRAGAPANVFPTQDGLVYLDAEFDGVWIRFAQLLGFDLKGEEASWADLDGRVADVEALEARVTDWTRARTTVQAEEELIAARVPVGRVRSLEEVVACPHLNERGFFQQMNVDGRISSFANVPLQFDRERPARATGWPGPGESNDYWYSDELGIDETRREDLVKQGVI